MRHLVRDVSRVLTLFLASRQAWPKILGGVSFDVWGKLPPKRCLDKTLPLHKLPAKSRPSAVSTRIYHHVTLGNACLCNRHQPPMGPTRLASDTAACRTRGVA